MSQTQRLFLAHRHDSDISAIPRSISTIGLTTFREYLFQLRGFVQIVLDTVLAAAVTKMISSMPASTASWTTY